ncbi:hypothetical protein ACFOOL_02140 [Devosia honganensis]|uniref:Uncharacterized protein n=1 Tax=Devosia honganensis TaxID=1610527 RepID=A0ABV7X090_9HYPH
MIKTDTIQTGIALDEIKIVVNSLYLSLSYLLDRVAEAGGEDAALAAREGLIAHLQSGDIDMAIMEDRKLFDFVVSVAEALPAPARPGMERV